MKSNNIIVHQGHYQLNHDSDVIPFTVINGNLIISNLNFDYNFDDIFKCIKQVKDLKMCGAYSGESYSFPVLTTVRRILISSNEMLKSLSFPKLTTAKWDITIKDNKMLTLLSFPELNHIGWTVQGTITGNPELALVKSSSFPMLADNDWNTFVITNNRSEE